MERVALRELREGMGWTQAELAAQVGVTLNAVNRWERGLATPRLAQLEKLAAAFGVPMDRIAVGAARQDDVGRRGAAEDAVVRVAGMAPRDALTVLSIALARAVSPSARGAVQRQANRFVEDLAAADARDRTTVVSVAAALTERERFDPRR